MKTLSASAINSYRSCPRYYRLSWIEGIKSEVEPTYFQFGHKIHELIASGCFESEIPDERARLQKAQAFLQKMPAGSIAETKGYDGNPGFYAGELFGERAVGIFDMHWLDPPLGCDWKAGRFYSDSAESFEIQSYLLNHLYKLKHGQPLRSFYFVFLGDGQEYLARNINNERKASQVSGLIQNAVDGINNGCFPKRMGAKCAKCDLKAACHDSH